jgi:hypothetical protein
MTYLPQIRILVPSAQVSSYSTGSFNLPSAKQGFILPAYLSVFNSGTGTGSLQELNLSTAGNAVNFGNAYNDSQPSASGNTVISVMAGGADGPWTSLVFSTRGNSTLWGSMQTNSYATATVSSDTRGILSGGDRDGLKSRLEYVTFASQGNGIFFGTGATIFTHAGVQSTTRGVYGGGIVGSTRQSRMDYITMASTGDSTSFGNLTVARGQVAGASSNTRGLFAGGDTPAYNIIDYITIASTGNATDFGDLTTARFVLGGATNQNVGVFAGGNGPSSVIDSVSIATLGNATSWGNLTTAKNYSASASSQAHGGIDISGISFPVIGEKAMFFGGIPSGWSNVVDFVAISYLGNARDFGDLSAVKRGMTNGTVATNSRAVVAGGDTTGDVVQGGIEYFSWATSGNATSFGTLSVSRMYLAGASNSTRGLYAGGTGGGGGGSYSNVIDYITIGTTGNATDFGDLTAQRGFLTGLASTTRACFAGGYYPSTATTEIQYVTIASTGNATNFGALTLARYQAESLADATRGVVAGGYVGSTNNTIDYFTIASTGNAIDFGDLTAASYAGAGAAGSTRGLIARGYQGSATAGIDYITIQSTGNASSFGNLSEARYDLSGASNSHGGL